MRSELSSYRGRRYRLHMTVAHAYHYTHPSVLETRANGIGCVLVGDRDGLFRGEVSHPRNTALSLRSLSQVVMSRFYMPPGMVLPLLDPVVTVGRRMLRFEGFSGCCSTYARLDLSEGAFSNIKERTPGTTNVDFQSPIRAALAKVRDTTPFILEVGREAVAIDTGQHQVVERKVPFPTRWLKGLGEVQAYLSRMEHSFTVSRAEALRFLRSLPRSSRHEAFVETIGRGLRLTQRPRSKSVRVTGVERLRVLEDLVHACEELRIHTDTFGASAWVLDLGDEIFTLVLSPERWRGFSGEGQLLSTLATANADDVLARVRASLSWQDTIEPVDIATSCSIEEATVLEALAMLASRGLTGYDLEQQAWYHRVLPFDLELVEALHPRLISARKLIAKGAVSRTITGNSVDASVTSEDVKYHVRMTPDHTDCTCPWYAKHRGERGPCKHVLAVQISLEDV